MIAILNYGMGNLRSVQKAFEQSGYYPEIVDNAAVLKKAKAIVLPGVGAFADAMNNLKSKGLDQVLIEEADKGKPLLGICLGMQLLLSASEEWGECNGLNLICGKVKKIPAGSKIPHMGWNQIEIKQDNPLFKGIPDNSSFYFVHSYYCAPENNEAELASTDYNLQFTSVIGKNNIFGIQFHPEKSSSLGLKILKNFGGVVERC